MTLQSLRHSGRSSESNTESSLDDIDIAKRNIATGLSRGRHAHVDRKHAAASKRWKTFWSAFRYLQGLTPKQVDDFMASYVIYNLDWSDEKQMIATLGEDYQQKVGDCLKAYYGVLNHLCALGDVEKMYIPPWMSKKATVRENQLLYEESIAQDIGLKSGDKDFNNLPLPFEDETFDAFYQIQALSLCKDIPALFREIYRVVKPGAKISSLDWVSLPAYDPQNPEHAELMRRVKPLIGAVGTPTPESLEKALTDAGFVVLKSDNASIDGLQAPLIDTVDGYFRAMRQVILGLVKLHLIPHHFKTLINRFCLDGLAFIKMDNMRLATTSYRIVAQKPARN
ncbi:hypothetical protein MAP00_001778 [Monascus purpureus]|nr:hypothetical protein MAP00_001778 [Monascus purpureus]